MTSKTLVCSLQSTFSFLAAGIFLAALVAPAVGAPVSEGGVPSVGNDPLLGVVPLATGPDSSADGFLSITVDEYGAWGDFGVGEAPDVFNPIGSETAELVAFSAGLFLFQENSQGRELLAVSPNWQAVFAPDSSLDRAVLVANIPSDGNGDGVSDSSFSQFEVTGPLTDLTFELSQVVESLAAGDSSMTQVYTITNNDVAEVNFVLVRVVDGDLVWSGDFSDDEVGTNANGEGIVSAFIQEANAPGSTRVTLSSTAADAYVGGKNGVTPGNGPPPYGFGTSTEIWDNFGLPPSWRNHIAGVGYDTDGESGTAPPGCDVGTGCDGFIGLSIPVHLASGETVTISIEHLYGGLRPPKDPCLTITGTCPGSINLMVTEAPPNVTLGIMNGNGPGSDVIPGGPCAGTTTDLNGLGLLTTAVTDASGSLSLDFTAPAAACGSSIQIVDTSSCRLSNVDEIP